MATKHVEDESVIAYNPVLSTDADLEDVFDSPDQRPSGEVVTASRTSECTPVKAARREPAGGSSGNSNA
jgi:hypothetical protein